MPLRTANGDGNTRTQILAYGNAKEETGVVRIKDGATIGYIQSSIRRVSHVQLMPIATRVSSGTKGSTSEVYNVAPTNFFVFNQGGAEYMNGRSIAFGYAVAADATGPTLCYYSVKGY